MLKIKKKGASQLDWAISLALFLLYLTWFFMFIRPQYNENNLYIPTTKDIIEDIKEKSSIEINKIPLFIESDYNLKDNLFTIDMDFFIDTGFIIEHDGSFIILDDILYFIDDINDEKKYYMITQSNVIEKKISNIKNFSAITIENDTVNLNSNFKIIFDEDSVEKIDYKNSEKITKISFYQDSENLDPDNFTIDNSQIFINMKESYQPFKVNYITTLNNQKIRMNIDKNDFYENKNISIKYDIKDVSYYYLDNNLNGNISSLNTCLNATKNKIMLKNSEDDSVLYIFDQIVLLNICKAEEDSATLKIIYENQDISYSIGFGNYSYDEELNEEYKYEFGFRLKNKDIYLPYFMELNSSDLKTHLTKVNGYKINLYNTTNKSSTKVKKKNLLKSIKSSNNTNTFTETFSKDIIVTTYDEKINPERMILNVVVW